MAPESIAGEVAQLRLSVEALTQGLRLMVETQDTHSEMLRAILEAATAEAPPSELPALLRQLIERLDAQTALLQRIARAATAVPESGTAAAAV